MLKLTLINALKVLKLFFVIYNVIDLSNVTLSLSVTVSLGPH